MIYINMSFELRNKTSIDTYTVMLLDILEGNKNL